MPEVKRLNFSIDIAAPPAQVARVMTEPDSYTQWTAAFCEGSRFEGSWAVGQRIRFLAPSGDGMLAEIAEHRPSEFISIRHLGSIANGVQDTDSDAVRAWAPACENYHFVPTAQGTTVRVEQDMLPDYEDFMREAWPKALAALKTLCEAQPSA